MLGFVSLLLVLVVPLKFFIDQFKNSRSELSVLGVYTVLSYAVFAVFSGIFDHQISTLFYTLLVVIIYGFINNQKPRLS